MFHSYARINIKWLFALKLQHFLSFVTISLQKRLKMAEGAELKLYCRHCGYT